MITLPDRENKTYTFPPPLFLKVFSNNDFRFIFYAFLFLFQTHVFTPAIFYLLIIKGPPSFGPRNLAPLGVSIVSVRRDVDAATLSAGVKGRLRAQGDKLLKRIASEKKAAAAAAAQAGVSSPHKRIRNSNWGYWDCFPSPFNFYN